MVIGHLFHFSPRMDGDAPESFTSRPGISPDLLTFFQRRLICFNTHMRIQLFSLKKSQESQDLRSRLQPPARSLKFFPELFFPAHFLSKAVKKRLSS